MGQWKFKALGRVAKVRETGSRQAGSSVKCWGNMWGRIAMQESLRLCQSGYQLHALVCHGALRKSQAIRTQQYTDCCPSLWE